MKKRIISVFLLLTVLAALTVGISALVCTNCLSIKNYVVGIEGITHESKIVLISDLHARQFGENNKRLIQTIAKQQPDAIFMVGDMINKDGNAEEVEIVVELISQLTEIAPVYYSAGNTELQYMKNGGTDVLCAVRQAGATALLDDYLEAEIGGNRVNIGFTMGHFDYTSAQWSDPPDYAMEAEVGADGTPAIVLMHMPESFISDIHDWWTGDLYLCGHTHGGVIRVPGIGGVFAPTQGWWPKYDRGSFSFDDGRFQMIITSGLAGHGWIPRIFNMPEISVIKLVGI